MNDDILDVPNEVTSIVRDGVRIDFNDETGGITVTPLQG